MSKQNFSNQYRSKLNEIRTVSDVDFHVGHRPFNVELQSVNPIHAEEMRTYEDKITNSAGNVTVALLKRFFNHLHLFAIMQKILTFFSACGDGLFNVRLW